MKKVWIPLLALLLVIIALDKIVLPLYIGSGRETSVPDVKNMSYDAAATALKHAGLEARKSYNVRYLPNVGSDVVIDQNPAPDSKVKPGRNVYLVLNRKDKPSYVIPDLSGRPEEEVRQVLGRLGMTVENVQQRSVSNSDEDGKVLSQSIPPNVQVKTGTAISLVVGKFEAEPEGMKRVVVPEVLGMSLDQAKSIIVQNGLTVGKINFEYSAILVPNTVISQKPAVNTFVQAGQEIEMTVVTNEQR